MKAETKARKEKATRIFETPKKAKPAIGDSKEEEDATASDTEMEVEGKEWAQRLTQKSSVEFGPQSTDLT